MAIRNGGAFGTNGMFGEESRIATNVSFPGTGGMYFVLGLGRDLLVACQSRCRRFERSRRTKLGSPPLCLWPGPIRISEDGQEDRDLPENVRVCTC